MNKPKKVVFIERLPTVKIPSKTRKYGFQHKHYSKYKCFCGNEFIVGTIFGNKPEPVSCGCYSKRVKHGAFETRLYNIWRAMKSRCYQSNNDHYQHYGGRGITICDEWRNDFIPFQDWALKNGYKEHLTIDREDNDGNYEPDNCRWITKKLQNINKRKNKSELNIRGVYKSKDRFRALISINGKSITLGIFDTVKEAKEAYEKAKNKREKQYLKEEKELL